MNYPFLIWSLLVTLVSVAFFDAEYFHRKRFELHLHAETLQEHFLHTLQSFIAPFAVLTLFTTNSSGLLLWSGVFFILANTVVTYIDAAEEVDSRRRFGGLPKLEYLLHLTAELLKGALIMVVILSKPKEAWGFHAVSLEPYPFYLSASAWLLCALGIYSAIEHVFLAKRTYHATRAN